MTAPNHALTGALIGLSVANPAVALPLAFVSHFVCDAIPHYDLPEKDNAKRLASTRFVVEFLVVGAALCFALVLVLAYTKPHHWLQAALGAFLAASPDLFWLPRFLRVRRTGKDTTLRNPFHRLHSLVQWNTGPKLIWLEAAWFVVFTALLWHYL